MADLFIRVEDEIEEILIARSAVAHARYRKATDTRPAKVMLLLFTKGLAPDPQRPPNVTMTHTRYEFEGPAAEKAWTQLWQSPEHSNGTVTSPA